MRAAMAEREARGRGRRFATILGLLSVTWVLLTLIGSLLESDRQDPPQNLFQFCGAEISGENPRIVEPGTPITITAEVSSCESDKLELHVFPTAGVEVVRTGEESWLASIPEGTYNYWVAVDKQRDMPQAETLIATSDLSDKARLSRLAKALGAWEVLGEKRRLTVGEETDVSIASSFPASAVQSGPPGDLASAELCLRLGDEPARCLKQSLDLARPSLPDNSFVFTPDKPGEVHLRADLSLTVPTKNGDIVSRRSTVIEAGYAEQTWRNRFVNFWNAISGSFISLAATVAAIVAICGAAIRLVKLVRRRGLARSRNRVDGLARILDQLDASAEDFTFPDIRHPNYLTIDCRLHCFADASRWALIVETVGCKPLHGEVLDVLHTYGNCLTRGQPGLESSDFLGRIENSDDIQDKDEPGTASGAAVVVRMHRLDLSAVPGEDLTNVFRRLVPGYRDLLFADAVELRRRIPADLPEILRLEEWHQPDLSETKPSESEVYRQVAEVLATADPGRYRPTEPPNTHWSS
ncbi:DUF7003 family protein [Ornithinibacter aureus]|uniref:DUF7003 family protein n=1 Tax=Ornithinibacter aureus TaxID=622664 RepID=UPI001FE97CCD|nr:hypothetical protein [Ornithinibacter aureus]